MNIKIITALIITITVILTLTTCNSKSGDSKQKTTETITENNIAETDPQQIQEQTWQLGDNIIATLSGETLTISGSGAIEGEGEFTEYGDYFISYPWSGEYTSVIISNGITEIGEGAFGGSSLTSVTIPNSVTVIGMLAFADSKLTNISFGNNVTHISHEAFARNNLTSVTIPNSVIKIGWSAFDDNPLTSITIGANVELDERVSFENGFDTYYDSNGKKAGTYTLHNGVWSLSGSAREVELFIPGENAIGMKRVKKLTDGTPADIVSLVVRYVDILPNDVALLSFTINGKKGHADMNAAYGNALKSTGTTGESYMVSTLVNTLLTFYNLEEITLTAEGKVIETGHAIYDGPNRFWDGK